jgi:CRISPR/Cas system CMR subunit Cmr4 (Cas7 group RAMP superfamily)
MRSKLKGDDMSYNLPTQPRITKELLNHEESRKVTENENYESLLSRENANKVYVDEINLNDLIDSNNNTKYINTEQSNINNKSLNKSIKDPVIALVVERVIAK